MVIKVSMSHDNRLILPTFFPPQGKLTGFYGFFLISFFDMKDLSVFLMLMIVSLVDLIF
jgi:hypothetical protein